MHLSRESIVHRIQVARLSKITWSMWLSITSIYPGSILLRSDRCPRIELLLELKFAFRLSPTWSFRRWDWVINDGSNSIISRGITPMLFLATNLLTAVLVSTRIRLSFDLTTSLYPVISGRQPKYSCLPLNTISSNEAPATRASSAIELYFSFEYLNWSRLWTSSMRFNGAS